MNITSTKNVPMSNNVLGVRNAKSPGTPLNPPERIEEAKVWPYVSPDAVGKETPGGVTGGGVLTKMKTVAVTVVLFTKSFGVKITETLL